MKKKQRCFFKRFAALVAALVISFSLPVSALAASDTEADMPSYNDFLSHPESWFVWRTRYVGGTSCYELACSPIFFDSSGNVSGSSVLYNYRTSLFDLSVISGDDSTYYYACALPVPLNGSSGFWSALPSFPVRYGLSAYGCAVSLYSNSSSISSSDVSCFLVPLSSSSSFILSNSSGVSTDSIVASSFFYPLTSYPFAFRSGSSSIRSSYAIQGGSTSAINLTSSTNYYLSFSSYRTLVKPNLFSEVPRSFSFPSTDLGLVVVSHPVPPSGGTINSASSFDLSSCLIAATLLVPVGMLPDVKLGDWISDSPEDLQKALTNDFDIDSGTLKNSKDNLNSWNSTSSVDSDVAAGATGLLNAVFQNLGTFLFSVSLLCFGAVVLRMLIRKAVDG